ncbi:MAG: TRAP transporter small permease subunit [Alphaproteobacteria bacterium]|nr:TRAP transporter small permease subunit [Alphaproteobacteria bacterium]
MTRRGLAGIEASLGLALRTFAVALFVGIAVLMTATVLHRFVPVGSMEWTDEIIELLLVWLVFTGTAEVWRVRQHFYVEIVPLAVAGTRHARAYRLALSAACLAFIALFTWQSFDLCLRAVDLSPHFSLPRPLWYGAMPFNGFLMCLFSLRELHGIWRDSARA